MKTFLPQNKFHPAPTVTIDARSAAATPCPHPLAAAASVSADEIRGCAQPETAVTDSCQEPVAADLSDDDLYWSLRRADNPNERDLPHIPDAQTFFQAIDPVWADLAPLFLRDR